MTLYFLDSSAIVKRYFQEPGHEWQASAGKPVSKTCLVRSAIAPLMTLDEMPRTPTACGWLMIHCTLLLGTCVARTNYELTMPSSWPVLWQCVRMFSWLIHLILSRLTISSSPQILGCSRLLSPKDSGMRTQITILRHTCRST